MFRVYCFRSRFQGDMICGSRDVLDVVLIL
jgi:hypothetical protein